MIDPDGKPYDYNLVDGIICWSGQTQVSPNGKWIAGTFRGEELNEDQTAIVEEYHAAFYNTETEKVYVIRDYGDSVGKGVTNDGIGLIGLGHDNCSDGALVEIESGVGIGKVNDWIKKEYGIIIPAGWIDYITADGKVVMGVSIVMDAMQPDSCVWYVAPALEE